MSCNLLNKILVIGVLFLFAFSAILPTVSVVSKEIATQETIDNQDEKVVTCYVFDKKDNSKQEVVLSSDDYERFYSMFEELNHQVTYNPHSSETKDLKEDFAGLIDSLGLIPEGSSKDDVLSLMNPSIGKPRSLFSLLPSPISNGRGSAFFCNFATWGEGSQFPIIILPRLIPILLIPIPRVIMRWNANYGITSCGGLLSGKGFIAEGAQTGTALGFWGIGFSVFLPPVMSFGFIGYALFATASAENIIPWPPNNPPGVSGETPSDGSVDVPLSLSELSFNLGDLDGDRMNYSVTTSPYIGGGSGNNVGDGTYSAPVSNLDSNTKYSWQVVVSDGEDTTEETYTFRTEVEAPFVSDPLPFDGDDWVSVDISELSFRLEDFQSDPMDFTVETVPYIGSGSGSGVGNGIYSVSVSGLDYTRLYTWFVNVTDGKVWIRKVFRFKTQPVMIFDPFDMGWSYRKQITVNHSQVAGNLSDFPVLISYVDPDLASKAQSDGDDILFMDGSGVADRLFHEIELYNSSSGELVCWVNVPNLSSTEDTVLYLYYGNSGCSSQEYPNMVWDSYYCGVWHLSEKSGTIFDSTLNDNDGSNSGATYGVIGKIGNSLDFECDDPDKVTFTHSSSLNIESEVTIELWFKPESFKYDRGTLFTKWKCYYTNILKTGQVSVYTYWNDGGSMGKSTYMDANTPMTINDWYHIAWSESDYGLRKIFLNGILDVQGNFEASIWGLSSTTYMGHNTHGSEDRRLDGVLDEVRISNIARSSSWISTGYNNQNNPLSFLSISSEELAP